MSTKRQTEKYENNDTAPKSEQYIKKRRSLNRKKIASLDAPQGQLSICIVLNSRR